MSESSLPQQVSAVEASKNPLRDHEACSALQELIRAIAHEEFGHHALPANALNIHLDLDVSPADSWDVRFDPDIRTQIIDQLAEAVSSLGAVQEGRAYCFRCETAECEHALPVSPLDVFKGYSETGTPQWHELSQALIDARHDDVHLLYEQSPAVLTLVKLGKELKGTQLSSFGRSSKTYSLLGQVIAGYFDVAPSLTGGDPADRRLAISFQFVETRKAQGRVSVELNPVCKVPGGSELSTLYAEGWCDWVQRVQLKADATLASMEKRINADPREERSARIRAELRKIPAIMKGFASSLERGHRQARRRTRHAQHRRQQQRPVKMAMHDLREAGQGFFLDDKTDAVIVPGDQNRFHVFNSEGKHVTSFVGTPTTREERLRKRRWHAMPADERQAFLKNVLNREKL